MGTQTSVAEQCEEPCNNVLDDIVTPIKIGPYHEMLTSTKYDKIKTDQLIKGFKEGFDIGYRGPMDRKDLADNIPLTIGNKSDLWAKLIKEVKANRFAGPFYDKIPYTNFIQSPIGLVPKAGNQMRLIFHLSYDFGTEEKQKSLNYHTPEEWCKVKYHDLDYAIKTCLHLVDKMDANEEWCDIYNQLGERLFKHIFYSKTDIKSAFRLVPILPRQRCLLLMKAYHPVTNKLAYFSDKCLPFGKSISCARFSQFSESLKHIIEFQTGRFFTVTNYLDDFLFIAKEEQECNMMVRSFIELCNTIGCPIALEKTEWASLHMTFLGLMLNGNSHTISIPVEKRNKAMWLLNIAIDRKKLTIRAIQQLTGTLNFLNRAIVPGRTFTRRMYDKLKLTDRNGKLLKSYHHVTLGKEFIQDCKMWQIFLKQCVDETNNLCRPYVDIDKTATGIELNFYTDASLSLKFGGMGGIFKNKWMIGQWNADFVKKENPSIGYLELFTMVAGIVTWEDQEELNNTRVTIFCDNKGARDSVNIMTTRCPKNLKLIRVLTLNNIKHNRRVFVKYVNTKMNTLADALSRGDMRKFWNNAPATMEQYPSHLPDFMWPVEKLWFNTDL